MEKATELQDTIFLANKILDRINADPDDDLAMLSRQFLRAREELAILRGLLREVSGHVAGELGERIDWTLRRSNG